VNNRPLYTAITLTGILILALVGVIFTKTSRKNAPNTSIESHYPITILYLDGTIIHFACLNTQRCFPDIDLSGQIKTVSNPDKNLFQVDFAYYGKDSTLYLLVTGSTGQYLAKVNLETKQVQALNPVSFIGGLNSGLASIVQGKLVLATVDGKISIIQDNFSVKTIADIKAPLLDFIEANDSKIAVISALGLLREGSTQLKIFLVNIDSGDVEEKVFDVPQERSWFFITIDKDLKYLYWIPADNTYILHKFDLQTQKNILSVPISNYDALTYTTQTAKRYQYHGIWYYSRRCCQEGPYPAMMMDMPTLKPVIKPEEFLINETNGTFMVSPFGNDFLIGLNSRVLIVSANGLIKDSYTLPSNWIGRDYLLLEYRK
jgi:hypothetical protein